MLLETGIEPTRNLGCLSAVRQCLKKIGASTFLNAGSDPVTITFKTNRFPVDLL
jgi:hypothetical protein